MSDNLQDAADCGGLRGMGASLISTAPGLNTIWLPDYQKLSSAWLFGLATFLHNWRVAQVLFLLEIKQSSWSTTLIQEKHFEI